jgi:outer membrane biosynthesis protein TonB
MKLLRLNVATLALWSALMLLAGCTHKKPVLVAPQPLPPAAAPEASPTPEPAQPADKTQAPQDAQPADQTKPDTTQADKSKPPQKPSPRKTAPASVANSKPPKPPVINNEATPSTGQVSPGVTTADAAHTEQLLKSAEATLNGINRQLSKEEEAKLSQAREFILQSRKATAANDSTRAYNLAVKARLLTDELVQR